jgi:hypothetical protein
MKQLPDPKTLNELLELAKDAFYSAKIRSETKRSSCYDYRITTVFFLL